ncbi:MAG: hypothetical protein V1848_02400 [Candidatus Magasanikbacteria bacterium]
MLKKTDLTEEEMQIFGERAAIREYDGNQKREEAEKGALQDIERRPMRRTNV